MNQMDLNSVPVISEPGSLRSTLSMAQKHRNKKIDKYCWLCHQMVKDESNKKVCKECPRVYHLRCIPLAHRNIPGNACLECKNVSVDGTEPITIFDKSLSKLLMLILNPMINKYKNFKTWPGETHKNNGEVCYEMELVLLRDRVKNDDYRSTAEFFADVKWIHHNASIVFEMKDPLIAKAKRLVTEMKTHLMDLEACVDCFYSLNADENAFVQLCHHVHELVWVKLKGHPYWPAKILKIINKKAHVVYFGSHERSRVCMADCRPLSKENPGGTSPTKESYLAAIAELEEHIYNHVHRFGKYQYAEQATKKDSLKRSLPKGKKQKRKRAKTGESQNNLTNIKESSQNHSSDITMISDSEVTSSMDNNDCELIEQSNECYELSDNMTNTLTVEMPRRAMADQAAQTTEIQAAQSSEIQATQSSEIQATQSSEIHATQSSGIQTVHSSETPGVELLFECSQEETVNYDDLSSRTNEKDLNRNESPETVVYSIIEGMLANVASTRSHNLNSDSLINDGIEISEQPPPIQAIGPDFFMQADRRGQCSQQVSEVAYETIMESLRSSVRDVCDTIGKLSNVNYTKVNRLRNHLFRTEQELESLKIRYQVALEEKRQMKDSANDLVAMLNRQINAFQRKNIESDAKIHLLESQVSELKKKIALASKPAQAVETNGLNTVQDAVIEGDVHQTSSHCPDVCAAQKDDQDNSKKSAKPSTIPEDQALSIDETSPTSTCFPPDSDDSKHLSEKNSNNMADLVPVLSTDLFLTSNDKEILNSELQSSAISSEAESDMCNNNTNELKEAKNI